jgi:ABC-type multidrug transport system permease subunit
MNNNLVYIYGIPVYFIAILSLIPAIYFAIVWPKQQIEAQKFSLPVQRFLRWANCLSWLCLSLALFAWGARSIPAALLLVILGGLIYMAFLVLFAGSIRRPPKKS